MNNFFNFLSESEKDKVLNSINTGEVTCEKMNIEALINMVSCVKSSLNTEISYCNMLNKIQYNSNLFSSIINAKNRKIDHLVDLYNNANTFNKVHFRNNEISFDKPTYLKNIKVEMDNFSFEYPILYKMFLYAGESQIMELDIIPYNYNGLYKEYFDKDKKQTTFKVCNKNTLYVYDCIYSDQGLVLGKELNLKYNKEFGFSTDGHLVLDRQLIESNELLVMYQPNENSFEFDINKKVEKIIIKPINDKKGIDHLIEKRLVMF